MNDNNTTDSRYFTALISRIFVWSLIFGVVYLLRSFSLLIFLTFVFAYIQSRGVNKLQRWVTNRTVRVVLVALILLGILIGVGTSVVPKVRDQGELFVERFPSYLKATDNELINLTTTYPILSELLAGVPEIPKIKPEYSLPDTHDLKGSVTAHFLQQLLGLGENSVGQENVKAILVALRNIGGPLLAIGSAFLLSLLFSFLIILDLPHLAAAIRNLRNTRIKFIYNEVADGIFTFAKVMGQALEAQLFIAMLNTILTALGIMLLGFGEQIPFLCMIVFFFSFIPVAGVFISSVPICLVALQMSGLGLMGLAILMITVIHMVETYILNPRIYGHHLRLNPVIVLIILTIGGKMFGVWGLVLGVPICTYLFGHAIRNKVVSADLKN